MFLFPDTINRIRRITGTGDRQLDNDIAALADYYRSVFDKYCRFFETKDVCFNIENKTIVELGPGDTLSAALFILAYGAARVFCFDRFELVFNIEKNSAIARHILSGLPKDRQQQLQKTISFNAQGQVLWDKARLMYLHNREERIDLEESSVDLIVSNAVLEHVQDLENLFSTMGRILRPGGLMVHAADLRSHGLHYATPLDFLAVSEGLWRCMTYYRGAPNRARKSDYEKLMERHGFDIIAFEATSRFAQEEINAFALREPELAASFSAEDLSCESILFSARKKLPG